jgi:hypothetical protein
MIVRCAIYIQRCATFDLDPSLYNDLDASTSHDITITTTSVAATVAEEQDDRHEASNDSGNSDIISPIQGDAIKLAFL